MAADRFVRGRAAAGQPPAREAGDAKIGSVLAGIALVVAGVLLLAAGVRPDPAHISVQGTGFVNTDRPGINNHNSPAAAYDPTRPSVVVVANRIDSPRFSCAVNLSTNSGATWRSLALPLAPGAPNCFWPDVAFDDAGRLLVLYTATGGRYNQPVGVWLQRFDGEQAAGDPVPVAGPEAFHAHFAVDGRRVVVAYVQTPPENADRPLGFEPGPNPLMVVRSEDGGATFGPPVPVSSTERVAHPSVVIGGGGEVVIGALDYGDDVENYEALHEGQGGPPPAAHWRVLAWRSTDGGATFPAAPAVVADRLPVPERVVIDLAPGPTFAADAPRGRVYAGWDAGTGDDRDVHVARSDDGGATWGPPLVVGPRPRGQLLPALATAPDGRVDLLFYDRSRDPEDVMAQPVVASSWDAGQTFTTRIVSPRPFDTRIGQGGVQAIPQLGNQLAVLSRPAGAVLGFWAEPSRATSTADVQVHDLAVGTFAPQEEGDRSWALLGVGAVLAAAGVAVAVSRRRTRPAPPAPFPPPR